MRMKLLPLLHGKTHAVHFFPLVKAFSGPAGSCGWELLARIVVCDHEIWLLFPCKLTAFSHSCSGLFLSATSSTRSDAMSGVSHSWSWTTFFCFTILVPEWSHPLPGLQISPTGQWLHRCNSALTSLSRLILQTHSRIFFSLAIVQASQMYHVQNWILDSFLSPRLLLPHSLLS